MSTGSALAFLLLAAVALFGAWRMITSRHPVHSALMLVTNFIATAGIYLLLGAPFLALVQVAVYAGAIMVLFLFILMYLNVGLAHDIADDRTRRTLAVSAAGVVALLILAGGAARWGGVVAVGSQLEPLGAAQGGAAAVTPEARVAQSQAALPAATVEAIGVRLFSDYALPFEVAGVLLLVALVGALVIAQPQLRHEARQAEAAGEASS